MDDPFESMQPEAILIVTWSEEDIDPFVGNKLEFEFPPLINSILFLRVVLQFYNLGVVDKLIVRLWVISLVNPHFTFHMIKREVSL